MLKSGCLSLSLSPSPEAAAVICRDTSTDGAQQRLFRGKSFLQEGPATVGLPSTGDQPEAWNLAGNGARLPS